MTGRRPDFRAAVEKLSYPGLSPTTGLPPASRTSSITALSTWGCVVAPRSGGVPWIKFGFMRTVWPGSTKDRMPPRGASNACTDSFMRTLS